MEQQGCFQAGGRGSKHLSILEDHPKPRPVHAAVPEPLWVMAPTHPISTSHLTSLVPSCMSYHFWWVMSLPL